MLAPDYAQEEKLMDGYDITILRAKYNKESHKVPRTCQMHMDKANLYWLELLIKIICTRISCIRKVV